MKKTVLAFLGLMVITMVGAQNTKNLVFDANAEVRNVRGFSAIEISGAIDLYISQGANEGVAVSAASDEVKQHIKAEVTNGTLHIYFDGKGLGWRSWTNTKTKAYVTFKDLKRVEASGACNVITTDPINVSDFKIDFSGASDFKGDIKATNLVISASGASSIKLAGTADKTSIEISGACNIKAYDFKTNVCNAEASGASNVRTNTLPPTSCEVRASDKALT
jgi:hypothetical protein